MTPEALADLHGVAMPKGRAWTLQAFADLMKTPGCFLTLIPSSLSKYAGESARGAAPLSPPATTQSAQDLLAFALGRVTLDEAELLTIVVHPNHRQQGLGRQCLTEFEAEAEKRGAKRGFLEVATSNHAALSLYRMEGWAEDGLRPDYYRTETGREDAILMSKTLKSL